MPTPSNKKAPGALVATSPTHRARSAMPALSPARAKAAGAGCAKSAAEWTMDASELVRELEATQKEVADMLSGQAAQEEELAGMKEACSSEVRLSRARFLAAWLRVKQYVHVRGWACV